MQTGVNSGGQGVGKVVKVREAYVGLGLGLGLGWGVRQGNTTADGSQQWWEGVGKG